MKTVTKLYNEKGQIVRSIALVEPTLTETEKAIKKQIRRELLAFEKYKKAVIFAVPDCVKLRGTIIGGEMNPQPQQAVKDITLW